MIANNSFFSGGVVQLSYVKSLASIKNDMEKFSNSLVQTNTYHIVRSVTHHLKWKISVR